MLDLKTIFVSIALITPLIGCLQGGIAFRSYGKKEVDKNGYVVAFVSRNNEDVISEVKIWSRSIDVPISINGINISESKDIEIQKGDGNILMIVKSNDKTFNILIDGIAFNIPCASKVVIDNGYTIIGETRHGF